MARLIFATEAARSASRAPLVPRRSRVRKDEIAVLAAASGS